MAKLRNIDKKFHRTLVIRAMQIRFGIGTVKVHENNDQVKLGSIDKKIPQDPSNKSNANQV